MRTLFVVSRMYTKEEFRKLTSGVPNDYDVRVKEYWDGVESAINKFYGKVKHLYYDSMTYEGERGMKVLESEDPHTYKLFKNCVDEGGAVLHKTEDPDLVEETVAWLQMKADPDVVMKMLKKNLEDRDAYVSKVINETLGDEETGLLVIAPARKIHLGKDVKIVKIQPFDPGDYLQSWIKALATKKKRAEKASKKRRKKKST